MICMQYTFIIKNSTKAPFTRYRFHSISDWPPVYTRTHQSDMLHTVFAFSNENALEVA